ncbi:maleylpyruvate isomerase family mycothiol-dependent enzyme [Sphingomonas sp. MMS24-JH45]
MRAGQAQGVELSRRMRDDWGDLTPPALFELWSNGWRQVADLLDATSNDHRMPWFGPEMSSASSAAARQMEVWAHGQDIYDMLGLRRSNADRIRAICDLGVRTQGWSFRNRGLDRPAPPSVELSCLLRGLDLECRGRGNCQRQCGGLRAGRHAAPACRRYRSSNRRCGCPAMAGDRAMLRRRPRRGLHRERRVVQ